MRVSEPSLSRLVFGLLALALVYLTAHNEAFGETESVLWSFGNGTDGAFPQTGLVMDPSGNLYGTTFNGGGSRYGTVFKLTPDGNESVFWNFVGGEGGGANPRGALIMDPSGNLYGTTSSGGASSGDELGGVVFKLTPDGKESALLGDSRQPVGLIGDTGGNLYGTDIGSGRCLGAFVFKLTPPSISGGNWNESVLWSFANGIYPAAGPILDSSGNLYGTTSSDGVYGAGTVYKLTPDGNESVLWSFGNGTDGATPAAGLTIDTSGNLYGTTQLGGTYGGGTVFKLTPKGMNPSSGALATAPTAKDPLPA